MAKGKPNGKTASATKTMEAMSDASGDAMKEAFERMTAFGGDFGEMSRSNLQALTQSLQIAGKGFTSVNTKAAEFMQATLQGNFEAAQAMSSVKSVSEFAELQSDFTRTSLETYMSQMSELSDMFTTTMKDAFEPLNAQASAVVEKFQKVA